jgi:RNA polymerase sigma-70 factor (ECF subfamily)
MGDQLKNVADERDAGATRALVLTFWPKVRAMLLRQGADPKTAEQIAQETMLAVCRKADQFSQQKESVSSWIYAIARNLRIDRVTRQAVWHRDHDEFETTDAKPSADQTRPRKHRRDVEHALEELPAEQMQVIQLSFVDGLSQSEIAARLNVPLDTVKSRMRLAFQKLRSTAEGGS